MEIKFQQSEPVADRRRLMFHLVDATDGITAKTGQTGQGYISKQGSTAVLTTNSMVEVDAVNMPGFYYIELTAGELDTLGFLGFRVKTASSAEFQDRAFVSYDDPAARHGGFAQNFGSGSSKSGGLTKAQANALLEDIRAIVQEELAKDELEDDAEEIQEQKDYTEKLDQILAAILAEDPRMPEPVDLSPVLTAIQNIPKATDYTLTLNNLTTLLKESKQMDMTSMNKMMADCQQMMTSMSSSIEGAMKSTDGLVAKFDELQTAMDGYKVALAEQSDMDKRFDAMTSAANNKVLADLSSKIKALALQLIDLNFNLKSKKLK